MKDKILSKFKKEINNISYEEEYHYKNLIIVKHTIRRFEERIRKDYIYLFALILLEYENIVKQINKNRKYLENYNNYIEIPIKYNDLRFMLVIRKDKIYKDKYVIKTIKHLSNLDYFIKQAKNIYYH